MLRLELYQEETFPNSSLPMIARLKTAKRPSVLTSAEFEKVFFIVCFIPFIGAKTPAIKASDFEYASSKAKFRNVSAKDRTRLLLNKRLPANTAQLPRDFSDNYINLIASVVDTPRSHSKPRLTQSRIVLTDKPRSRSLSKGKPSKSASSRGAPLRSKQVPRILQAKEAGEPFLHSLQNAPYI
jgi:hypothetical protein